MLVEGFTPPSSYSPSPGDVQKEIEQSSTIPKDDFAKDMGYESFQDKMCIRDSDRHEWGYRWGF